MATTTDTVRVTIDGIPISVPKGTLVIEAARRVGVMIPHFCYHPKLKPDANCRMCLVEIEKMPKLQTSCSTVATEGMSIRTATTVVHDAHKSVLEFILANHPLDCPVCDQGGKCDLQDFSHQYTATTSRFAETTQAGRYGLQLLRRRLPDHGPNQGPAVDRSEQRPGCRPQQW